MTYSSKFNLTTTNPQALALYKAAQRNDGNFIIEGVDVTDVLRTMAAAYEGTQESLGGVSTGGLQESMKRVGRTLVEGGHRMVETTQYLDANPRYEVRPANALSFDWDWVRYGDLKAFGLKRAVWGPGRKTDDQVILNPRALFNPRWEQAASEVYRISGRCRDSEFKAQLGQLRGVYLMYRLQNLFNEEAAQGGFKTKATRRYSSMLARLFDGDPTQNLEAEGILVLDLKRAGVFELA